MKTIKEANYSLKEARSAVQWYKKEYGIDHSHLLSFLIPGISLDDFVNKLYAGKLGKNERSFLVKS